MRFEVKALYGVPELAKMAGVSPPRMRRMLKRNGIKLQRNGRHLMVPLSEINEKMHWLKESLEVRDMVIDSMAGQMPQ
jgi:phage antirepressor YoqD-like protein